MHQLRKSICIALVLTGWGGDIFKLQLSKCCSCHSAKKVHVTMNKEISAAPSLIKQLDIGTMASKVPAKISRKRSLQSISYGAVQPKKTIRIVSSLPSRLCDLKTMPKTKSPQNCLIEILDKHGIKARVVRFDAVKDVFEDPKQEEIDAYGFDALEAVRQRDVAKLRKFLEDGRPLKCSNRFGESLLHLACRKGFHDVVEFLVNDAKVPVWVKDDFGRTPLSDACWTIRPNFELMDLLISKAPDLLLISDARGHCPLAYVRREHWEKWNEYLRSKQTDLLPRRLQNMSD